MSKLGLGLSYIPTTEHEIKLRLHDKAQSLAIQQHPLLKKLICQYQELRSIYLDTIDVQLQQQDMALRLRCKDGKWLQTLKTKGVMIGGLFSRHELETPIAEAKPDFIVLAADPYGKFVARKKIRKQLRPLFETVFTRQCWHVNYKDVCIEVALDTGFVCCGKKTTPLLELELELVTSSNADIVKLYSFARKLCANIDVRIEYDSKAAKGYALRFKVPKPQPNKAKILAVVDTLSVEESFINILQSCLQQIQYNTHAILYNDDPEGVHQLRVSLRRIRTCFHFFVKIIPRTSSKIIEQKYNFLLSTLGMNRDADVFYLDCIEPLLTEMPQLQPVADYILDKRHTALQDTRKLLDSAEYAHFMLYFGQWLAAKSWRKDCETKALAQNICDYVPARLSSYQQRIQDYNKYYIMSDDKLLHKLRIDVKKIRYARGFFASNVLQNKHNKKESKRNQAYNKGLSELQDVLGLMHDHYIAKQILAKMLLETQQAQNIDIDLCQSICLLQGWISGYRPYLLQQIEFIRRVSKYT
ncbi:MAG: CHAD domain-containing protein [Mariprofundales bacterium]